MQSTANPQNGTQFVAYDKVTGTVIQTYSRSNVEGADYVEVSIDDLRNEFAGDQSVVSKLTDSNPENLAIIRVDPAQAMKPSGLLAVDVNTQGLVVKPTLTLTSSKTELSGDGNDRALIEVRAVDSHGIAINDFRDEIRITTERGKLSERGGIVKMENGYAKIELASVNETVRRVHVSAESLSGKAGRSEIVLEFV